MSRIRVAAFASIFASVASVASLALSSSSAPCLSPPVVLTDAPKRVSLNDRIANILPKSDEEKWLAVGWRVNLMAAREEAQHARKPLFLWIMVGNPQGCT